MAFAVGGAELAVASDAVGVPYKRRPGYVGRAPLHCNLHCNLQDQVGDTNGATLSGSAWEVACASAATQDNTLSRAPGNRAMAVGDDAWATTKGGAWRVYPVDTHVVADATFDVNSGGALRWPARVASNRSCAARRQIQGPSLPYPGGRSTTVRHSALEIRI